MDAGAGGALAEAAAETSGLPVGVAAATATSRDTSVIAEEPRAVFSPLVAGMVKLRNVAPPAVQVLSEAPAEVAATTSAEVAAAISAAPPHEAVVPAPTAAVPIFPETGGEKESVAASAGVSAVEVEQVDAQSFKS